LVSGFWVSGIDHGWCGAKRKGKRISNYRGDRTRGGGVVGEITCSLSAMWLICTAGSCSWETESAGRIVISSSTRSSLMSILRLHFPCPSCWFFRFFFSLCKIHTRRILQPSFLLFSASDSSCSVRKAACTILLPFFLPLFSRAPVA